MEMEAKEGVEEERIPLTQKEATIRKSLIADNKGEYSVVYDLILVT